MVMAAPMDIYQAGLESTKGTLLAATAKLLVERLNIEPTDAVNRPQNSRGLMVQNQGGEFIVTRGGSWSAEGVLNYEQLPAWLGLAVQGGVSPSGVGPYTYVHTLDPTAYPTFDSWTLERRADDGAAQIDHEWGYVMARSIEIRGARGADVRYSLEGFARRQQSSTLTAALSAPTPESIPHSLSKIFVDANWAGLGGSQLTGQVLDWRFRFNNGLITIDSADGRSDLDFNRDLVDGRQVALDVEITTLLEDTQYGTEKTAAEAQALRAVRIQLSGTDSRDITIDFLAKYAAGGLYQFDEVDGQRLVVMRLVGATDLTNQLEVTVINQQATAL